jgi:hypothetical protein
MSHEEGERLERAYEILHLSDQASLDQVKRAYATLIRTESRSEDNWVRLKEMDWAYEVLSERLFDPSDGVRLEGHEEKQHKPVPKRLDTLAGVAAYLFPPVEDGDPLAFVGRVVLSVVLAVWGFMFAFSPMNGDYLGRSFMHLINLPFHEAGHLFFSFLGDFLRVLGGTLTQVLIPLICVAAFIRRRDVFGAACALWWTGQSLIDAAPYIYDARAGELMLLGGVTGQEAPEFHDWHNILGRLGLLSWDHSIAYGVKAIGVFLILASCVWSGWYMLRNWRNLRKSRP